MEYCPSEKLVHVDSLFRLISIFQKRFVETMIASLIHENDFCVAQLENYT